MSDGEPTPACNVKRCILILGLANLLTPLDTQAPTPIIPVLFTEDLEMTVRTVGALFATMTCGALISFGMLFPMAKRLSPQQILLFDYALRFASGLVYLSALSNPGGHSWTVPMMFVARFMYGLTLNSFALPTAWIGVRMPATDRPNAVVAVSALLGLGIAFGPVLGATLASVMPTPWAGYRSMGYFTLCESAFIWLVVLTQFDDKEVMPTAKKDEDEKNGKSDSSSEVQFIIMASVWASFFLTMGQMAGFEALFGVAILQSYGWREASALPPWVTFGLVIMSAYISFKPLTDNFNTAKVAVGSTIGTCLVALLVNFFDLSEPVPEAQVFVGLLGNGPAVILFTMFQTILSTRVPREQQVKANAILQFMGQVGRGIGPVVSTFWYQTFTDRYGRRGGMNAAGLNFAFFLIVGASYAFSRFTTFFGKFDEPSPREKREGVSKQMV